MRTRMPFRVQTEDYVDAIAQDLGWCTVCQDFTRDCTEPDASDYDCPQCDNPHSVMGAEVALISNFIDLL